MEENEGPRDDKPGRAHQKEMEEHVSDAELSELERGATPQAEPTDPFRPSEGHDFGLR